MTFLAGIDEAVEHNLQIDNLITHYFPHEGR